MATRTKAEITAGQIRISDRFGRNEIERIRFMFGTDPHGYEVQVTMAAGVITCMTDTIFIVDRLVRKGGR
jgi:hypothetical protein